MILATYQVVTGCIIGLSILLMVYLAIRNPSERISSILMAMGMVTLAFGVLAPPGKLRNTVSLLGVAPFMASLILSVRSFYARSPRRQA